MLSGKFFDQRNIRNSLKSVYNIEMPDDLSAQKLFDELTAEEQRVIQLLTHNAMLRTTMTHFGNENEGLRDGIPRPGIADFEYAARLEIDLIHSPSQCQQAINNLRKSIACMQKFDNDTKTYETFFRKVIVGNGEESVKAFESISNCQQNADHYKTQKKIGKFFQAMITCDAVQSLKLFLPKLIQATSAEELYRLNASFIFPIIETGKHRVLDTLIECGFCQQDMRFRNGETILLLTLFDIAAVSWRHFWILEDLRSSDPDIDNQQIRRLLLQEWGKHLHRAVFMLHVLCKHFVDVDLEIPSLRHTMENSELNKVIYLNHHAKTARELAAAYLTDLPLQNNMPNDIKWQLEELFTRVTRRLSHEAVFGKCMVKH